MKHFTKVALAIALGISTLNMNVDLLAQEALQTKVYLACDINRDGKKENIYIKGNWEACKLIIKDSTNKKILCGKDFGGGYDGQAFVKVADFNKDGVKDILVNISQAGSGCFNETGVYSFKGNKLVALKSMDSYDKTSGITLQGVNMQLKKVYPKYYAIISSTWSSKKYTLDITNNPSISGTSGEYEFGSGWQGGPSGIYDYNKDGQMDLFVSSDMDGNSHGDTIAYLKVYYTYKNGKWVRLGYDVESEYPKVSESQMNKNKLADIPLVHDITRQNMNTLFNTTFEEYIERYGKDCEVTSEFGFLNYTFEKSDIAFCFGRLEGEQKSTDKPTMIMMFDNNQFNSTIMGIKTGMSISAVEKVLGKPKYIGEDEVNGGECARYEIDGHSLFLDFNNNYSYLYCIKLKYNDI